MRDIPAIGPGGEPTGKTYGQYEETAQMFLRALLEVWREGDQYGHPFAFPKCDLHISHDTFRRPMERELLAHGCQIASENGAPYFVFDRDAVTLSACCRLRTTIRDSHMLRHLESMRFCGFQNVTVNLPQCAYRAGPGNEEALFQEITSMMDLAVQAHLEKRRFIQSLMSSPELPLWQIGKSAADGRPYVDLDQATYIIGLIGLNECVRYLYGKELHEDDQAFRNGLRIVSFMKLKADQESKRLGMHLALEESPAESASRRLAKIDLRSFPQAVDVIAGDLNNDEAYYTNSIHLRADAPVDLLTRIRQQSLFHPLIESGAIIHAFVGEARPPAASIYNLVEKTFHRTKAAQLTISPEFTICNQCHQLGHQLASACEYCHSEDVYGITRIVGYYSRINNWNKSKLGELKDRHRGNYGLATERTNQVPELIR
jgi:ribonucleoside-triphosphate reductase